MDMMSTELTNKKGRTMKKLLKILSRCRTINNNSRPSTPPTGTPFAKMVKSKSFYFSDDVEKPPSKRRVAPEGCFTVYVGPEKRRFVIKTDYVNHPLFKMLLEEAEREYGFCSEGPLTLPCEVDLFDKVLWEMSSDEIHHGCRFTRNHSAFRLLSPTRG